MTTQLNGKPQVTAPAQPCAAATVNGEALQKPEPFDPANRTRCVDETWKAGHRVRILHDAFGYGGKTGTIRGVGKEFVYVEIQLGKKIDPEFGREIDAWDEVAYRPDDLRLITKRNGSS